MLFALYLFIIIFFTIHDLIPIISIKNWKLLTIYASFMLFSLILDIFSAFHVKVPSSAVPIRRFIEFIFKLQG